MGTSILAELLDLRTMTTISIQERNLKSPSQHQLPTLPPHLSPCPHRPCRPGSTQRLSHQGSNPFQIYFRILWFRLEWSTPIPSPTLSPPAAGMQPTHSE